VPVAGGAAILPEVAARLAASGLTVSELALRRPRLEEAFLTLTGEPAAGPADPPPASAAAWPASRTRSARLWSQPDCRRSIADVSSQRGDHVFSVAVHAAQGIGGERALELQADVDQARVRGRDPAGM